MALSKGEKTGYTICLVLTILLVGLHIAVVVEGYKFAKDIDDQAKSIRRWYPQLSAISNLLLKEQKQELSFVIVAAGLTFFISIALLFGLYSDALSPRAKQILAALNLILEFAIAVVISLRASNLSNLRDLNPQIAEAFLNFKEYYRLSIADAVITFALEVVYLFFIFLGTLNENTTRVVVPPVITELPPLSNRQF